eukprot:s1489_g6.t1
MWMTRWPGLTSPPLLSGPCCWRHPHALEAALKLADEVDWIGWRISTHSWTLFVPPSKLEKIRTQLAQVLQSKQVPIKGLQSIVGRLLWLTSAWHYLRPLLIPLYKAMAHIIPTMVGMDHPTFVTLLDSLDDELVLQREMIAQHHSLQIGVALMRIANTVVTSIHRAHQSHIKSRRVRVGVRDPTSPMRLLGGPALHTLSVWDDLLQRTPFVLAMTPATAVPVHATADAMADARAAGFGGAAFFADGSCSWTQFRITLEGAQSLLGLGR